MGKEKRTGEEEGRRKEGSKFQEACQKWENLSTDSLLEVSSMAKGGWEKCSNSFPQPRPTSVEGSALSDDKHQSLSIPSTYPLC